MTGIKTAVILCANFYKMLRLIAIFVLLVTAQTLQAQWDMRFCDSTNITEKCKPAGSTLKWAGDRITQQLVLTSKDGIGSEKLRFMIFFMKTETQADLYADLSLSIPDTTATAAVKKVMFHKKGVFRIDVLDAATNHPLTSGIVTVAD